MQSVSGTARAARGTVRESQEAGQCPGHLNWFVIANSDLL